MKNKLLKSIFACGFALALISGAASLEPLSKVVDFTVTAQAADGDTVSFDESTGILWLKAGNVKADDVGTYDNNEVVTEVIAEKGAVLPVSCAGLFKNFKAQKIDLSNADARNVQTTSEMFMYCESLTSLDLSSFNTDKVTYMDDMFRNCKSLKSLDLSSFNTSEVKRMVDMFRGCENLEKLDLRSFEIDFSQHNSKYNIDDMYDSLKAKNIQSKFLIFDDLERKVWVCWYA